MMNRGLSTTTSVLLLVAIVAVGGIGLFTYGISSGVPTTTVCCTSQIHISTTMTSTSNMTVATSNSSVHYVTMTRDCSGVPVCGISRATTYTDNTTTVVLFVYPSSETTSTYTLTLTHETSETATNS